jgi:hypothetical protein
MNHKTLFIALFPVFFQGAFAQQNTVSSGGNATGTGGEVSYTIGQIDYINSSAGSGSFNQGVQQPYEFFVAIDELKWSVQLTVYPNPFSETVNISGAPEGDQFTWKIFDTNGKVVKEGSILAENTQIDLHELEPATYYLRVNRSNTQLNNFKIVKSTK